MTHRPATLVFLVKRKEEKIDEICLAMKKRGFGANRYNGVGGKVEESDASIEAAAIRETEEEIEVTPSTLDKVAEITFDFTHSPALNLHVHVYLCESWEGIPTETEEMAPSWFHINDIPYDSMWPDDSTGYPTYCKTKP